MTGITQNIIRKEITKLTSKKEQRLREIRNIDVELEDLRSKLQLLVENQSGGEPTTAENNEEEVDNFYR